MAPMKASKGECMCQHGHVRAVKNEQHFQFDCPLDTAIKEQYDFRFGPNQGSICPFLERIVDQMPSCLLHSPVLSCQDIQ